MQEKQDTVLESNSNPAYGVLENAHSNPAYGVLENAHTYDVLENVHTYDVLENAYIYYYCTSNHDNSSQTCRNDTLQEGQDTVLESNSNPAYGVLENAHNCTSNHDDMPLPDPPPTRHA